MSVMIVCKACGESLRVPRGHDGPHIRCPACGAICEVPREAPSWAVTAGKRPPAPAPVDAKETDTYDDADVQPWSITASPSHAAPQQPTNDEEDDDSPYAVPPDPNEKTPCPKCRASIAIDATICAHCGYDQQTGEIHEREYEPVDLQWETGLPFRIRMGIFAAVGSTAVLATLVVGIAQGEWLTYIITLLIGMVLQAYALGTYSRLNLTRTNRGRVRMMLTWRVGFIPLRTIEVRWREYEGVTARQSGEADFWDLIIFLFLLPWGLIPAIIFWIFMIQPGQFDVALTQGHGYPARILYRGPNQSVAQEIAAKIREYTSLP
jgi:hypothetical protein